MTNDTSGLEADITEERNALARSLDELSSEFSPEKLVNSVGDTLKSQSESLANTIVQGARENPVALGLMGAGLAWLLVSKSTDSTQNKGHATYDTPPAPGPKRDHEASSLSDPGRIAAAGGQMHEPRHDDPSRLDTAKTYVRQTAQQMRDTLNDGTEKLSDAARARVVQAREKALDAQARVEATAGRAVRSGRNFYTENPLIVGAGIAVAGAAVAFALPRTDTEDRLYGRQRDALVHEAERIFHEEVERAKSMGEAAVDEVQTMAEEAVDEIPSGREAVDLAEEKLRKAGERVKDRTEQAQES